ncbi:MAG: PIG-L deacetylase family protein [Verrucomicrobiota bacterium]
MQTLNKIWQRLTDPVFYRKRIRQVLRCCAKVNTVPNFRSVEELGEVEKAAVVVAHPDDETFCSGLICSLVERGVSVDLFCLTRGEGGPTGEWSRQELGQVREKEMRRACEKLGIRELVFLDHIDPVAREHRVFAPEVSPEDLAHQLTPLIAGHDLIISHGSSGEYWHPAHLLVHEAVKKCERSGRWLTFLSAQDDHPIPKLINEDDSTDLILDVSGFSELREEVLASHESQASLFCRFAGGTLADFIAKTSQESYCLKDRGNG